MIADEAPQVLICPKDLCEFRLHAVYATGESMMNFFWVVRLYKPRLIDPIFEKSFKTFL